MIIAYLGPEGTSDHRAISLLKSVKELEPLPMTSISDVVETVNFTPQLLGIIPLENSTDGEMTTNLDKLIFEAENVLIREEVVLAESINAYCLDPSIPPVTVVSHPLILDLCSNYIKQHSLAVRHSLSTTEAARLVMDEHDPTLIALAPPVVGEAFDLELVANSVMNVPDIRTRYVMIGREVALPTGDDRTSVVITPNNDHVGFLSAVAGKFAENDVNMNHILSRPLAAKVGNYSMHIVFEGHITDAKVQALMADLVTLDASVKLLGSYPRWRGVEVCTPSPNLPKGSVDLTLERSLQMLTRPPIAR